MAARIAKNIIRALVREKMKTLKVPSSEPYRQLVLALFNLFSNRTPASTAFWTSTEPPIIDLRDTPKPGDLKDSDKRKALEGGLEFYIWKAAQFRARYASKQEEHTETEVWLLSFCDGRYCSQYNQRRRKEVMHRIQI